MAQRTSQNQHAAPLAANLGLVRPPAIYLTTIVTGLVLHFAWPISLVPSLAIPFGALIAVFAAARSLSPTAVLTHAECTLQMSDLFKA